MGFFPSGQRGSLENQCGPAWKWEEGSSSWNKCVNPTSACSPVGDYVFGAWSLCVALPGWDTCWRRWRTGLCCSQRSETALTGGRGELRRQGESSRQASSWRLTSTALETPTSTGHTGQDLRGQINKTSSLTFQQREKSCSWCIHRESDIEKR